jgi:hypothetical protein
MALSLGHDLVSDDGFRLISMHGEQGANGRTVLGACIPGSAHAQLAQGMRVSKERVVRCSRSCIMRCRRLGHHNCGSMPTRLRITCAGHLGSPGGVAGVCR